MTQSERFEMRIDSELKAKAEREAASRDKSLAEMIRSYLRRVTKGKANETP